MSIFNSKYANLSVSEGFYFNIDGLSDIESVISECPSGDTTFIQCRVDVLELNQRCCKVVCPLVTS